MLLLPKKEAKNKIRKQNEQLMDDNTRLNRYYSNLKSKVAGLRGVNEEQIKEFEEFEVFVKNISEKKSKLLKELKDIQEAVEEKKELYYGLVEKQDLLDEREYRLNRKTINLNDREKFIKTLEAKQKTKING